MSYYVNQSNIQISLDTTIDLTLALATRILYKKPNGVSGFWPATKAGTILNYQLLDGDIDQSGVWKFQSYCEIGASKCFGNVVEMAFDKALYPH